MSDYWLDVPDHWNIDNYQMVVASFDDLPRFKDFDSIIDPSDNKIDPNEYREEFENRIAEFINEKINDGSIGTSFADPIVIRLSAGLSKRDRFFIHRLSGWEYFKTYSMYDNTNLDSQNKIMDLVFSPEYMQQIVIRWNTDFN